MEDEGQIADLAMNMHKIISSCQQRTTCGCDQINHYTRQSNKEGKATHVSVQKQPDFDTQDNLGGT